MRPFDYIEPTTLDEAVAAAHTARPDALLMAGGQTLLILLRMGIAQPATVIWLGRVAGMRAIGSQPDGDLVLGAMATYDAVARSPIVAERAPLLARVAGAVGSMHIRELGTIGGAVAHADPAADVPAALMALDGRYVIASVDGERVVPAHELATGLLQTRIEPGMVLARILVGAMSSSERAGFARFVMREGEYPLAQAAVRMTVDAGVISEARLVVGGAADRTIRLEDVEEWLEGTTPEPSLAAELAERVRSRARPPADHRGSSEWKADVVGVMAKRALIDALPAAGSANTSERSA